MRSRNTSPWVLLILILVGMVLGGVLGDLFRDLLPWLGKSYAIGTEGPIHLNLWVLTLTFGFRLALNLASVLGFLLAVFLYRKL